MRMLERAIHSEIKLASMSSMGGKPSTPNQGSTLANPDVQILRVGKFNHPKYGEFEITPLTLMEMKSNFDRKIRGIDIAFDYFHESDKEASGWPTELYLTTDGNELWAKVDWTPSAQRKLAEREIRYFSPDFAFEWTDPETGVGYKNVLFGGGLTNRPFVKDMAAIVAAEGTKKMTLDELTLKVLKLDEASDKMKAEHGDLLKKHEALMAEHEAMKKKLAEYEEMGEEKPGMKDKGDKALDEKDDDGDEDSDMDAMKKKLDEVDGRNKKLEKELNEMKEGKKLAEKKAAFTLLLSEGKACAAQEKAFMAGDMTEFARLSQPINLAERGTSYSPQEGSDDKDGQILKLAEDLRGKNPKLTQLEAINLAQRQVK